ncbi:MAG: sulfotransferase [Amaricoccus sp.]|uniref:sulfotransferase family protein n=1 Tax=Amaricoccus sp. TaxID=1872485 RepID=UPI0039E4030B
MPVPAFAKRLAGTGLGLAPHARHDRCLFLLGHMRCGSTALSNVLCAHPEISGYGESHVDHGAPSAPGRLVLNQIGAGRWKPAARHLFDKVLHDHLDAGVPPAFFAGRAIFLTRAPEPSIASILALFASLGNREYPDPASAAAYYTTRLARLAALWDGFPPERRLALRHETLIADPDAALARLTGFLALERPLTNAYRASPTRPGAGDPLAAGWTTIAAAAPRPRHAGLSAQELAAATAARAAFLDRSEP